VVAGRQAARDHGGATQLRVQASSKVTYLAFDLSALPGPPAHATLILSVTKGAPDAGTVSRVDDTSWTEGRGTERSAATGGLGFADLDTNHDGRLAAGDASPLVPSSGSVVASLGPARRRKLFLLDGQGADVADREYGLATYFLATADRDGITHDHGTTPDDWWADGWEVSLGAAPGARFAWNGLWRRDFAAGLVLVNPPGAPARTVTLDAAYRDLGGTVVTSVHLGPAQGAVLRLP